MRIHSEAPVEVGAIDPAWHQNLESTTHHQAHVKIYAADKDPCVLAADKFDPHTLYTALKSFWGKDRPAGSVELNEPVLDLTQSIDREFRERREVPASAVTKHLLSVRAGLGNYSDYIQLAHHTLWPNRFPNHIRQGRLHPDYFAGPDADIFEATYGGSTVFYEG